jgi:microcystin-dependent protein
VSEPFLGEIRAVGFNFPPVGWAVCAGQLMSIAQNTALFSLLGTQYGGDGVSTFALPDLRGRVPNGAGQGPGLNNYVQGQVGGAENVTLTNAQLPNHTHPIHTNAGLPTTDSPSNAVLSGGGSYSDTPDGTTLSPTAVGAAGSSQPVSILNPYLTMNWIIALQGIFPSQN